MRLPAVNLWIRSHSWAGGERRRYLDAYPTPRADMGEPSILVTNDDGIDATGLHALADALAAVGDVTVVAPADDQSAVGRATSHTVTVQEHERGFVIEGTPADCVIAGLSTLCPETDILVAGCNRGANLGTAALGRSGTVSAAVEAAFFEVPAIAVSMYVPPSVFRDGLDNLTAADYERAVDAAAYLVKHGMDDGIFAEADYLNVNAPMTSEYEGEMKVTRPSQVYEIGAERDGEEITVVNYIWEMMEDGEIPDPPGSDRRAIHEDNISVSPLAAPHSTHHTETLDALADAYSLETDQ